MRVEYEGALYHVTARGNAKAVIFWDDIDRHKFLDTLECCTKAFKFVCHGYCIMQNHYHLLIETPDANLSAGVQWLNSVYAQYLNRVHDRVGHVFQGRFKAILVQRENYLLELSRYIVLNPVRAGIVKDPAKYRWSSYCKTTGTEDNGRSFLNSEWILAQFGIDIPQARISYMKFVKDGINRDSPLMDIQSDLILGDRTFIKAQSNRLSRCKDDIYIPKKQRFACREDLSSIFRNLKFLNKDSRNKLIFKAYSVYGYTQKALAEFLNLHVITIGRILKNYR